MLGSEQIPFAIYVDGETKTGKGSASEAIAKALENEGYNVYYDVAGDFYRRYTALAREQLELGEDDALPDGDTLETVAKQLYDSKKIFERPEGLGDLQRPAISKYVSMLGELPLAQLAGKEWWAMTLRQVYKAGANVFVVDGRNPRLRMQEAIEKTGLGLTTALDLYMTCEPREAARRTLLTSGVTTPTLEQISEETAHVADRRSRDRLRADTPFIVPANAIHYDSVSTSTHDVLTQAWVAHGAQELPTTIIIDNTTIAKPDMLAAVCGLATESMSFKIA
jgi:cytidylate kinase